MATMAAALLMTVAILPKFCEGSQLLSAAYAPADTSFVEDSRHGLDGRRLGGGWRDNRGSSEELQQYSIAAAALSDRLSVTIEGVAAAAGDNGSAASSDARSHSRFLRSFFPSARSKHPTGSSENDEFAGSVMNSVEDSDQAAAVADAEPLVQAHVDAAATGVERHTVTVNHPPLFSAHHLTYDSSERLKASRAHPLLFNHHNMHPVAAAEPQNVALAVEASEGEAPPAPADTAAAAVPQNGGAAGGSVPHKEAAAAAPQNGKAVPQKGAAAVSVPQKGTAGSDSAEGRGAPAVPSGGMVAAAASVGEEGLDGPPSDSASTGTGLGTQVIVAGGAVACLGGVAYFAFVKKLWRKTTQPMSYSEAMSVGFDRTEMEANEPRRPTPTNGGNTGGASGIKAGGGVQNFGWGAWKSQATFDLSDALYDDEEDDDDDYSIGESSDNDNDGEDYFDDRRTAAGAASYHSRHHISMMHQKLHNSGGTTKSNGTLRSNAAYGAHDSTSASSNGHVAVKSAAASGDTSGSDLAAHQGGRGVRIPPPPPQIPTSSSSRSSRNLIALSGSVGNQAADKDCEEVFRD